MPAIRVRVTGDARALLGWLCVEAHRGPEAYAATLGREGAWLYSFERHLSTFLRPHGAGEVQATCDEADQREVIKFVGGILGDKAIGKPYPVSDEQLREELCEEYRRLNPPPEKP